MRRQPGGGLALDSGEVGRAQAAGRDEGGEPVWPQPQARFEPLWHGRAERVEHRPLAAVHRLKAVQPDVGEAQLRSLDLVADLAQGIQHQLELARVVRLVRLQDQRLGPQRQRLLQRQPRLDSRGGRQAVEHQRTGTRAVDDQDGALGQLRPPRQFQARAESIQQDATNQSLADHLRRPPFNQNVRAIVHTFCLRFRIGRRFGEASTGKCVDMSSSSVSAVRLTAAAVR